MRKSAGYRLLRLVCLLLGIVLVPPLATGKNVESRELLVYQSTALYAGSDVQRPVAALEVASQLTRLGAYPLDETLVARLDDFDVSHGPLEGLFNRWGSGEQVRSEAVGDDSRFGLRLPPPNHWTAVFATMALGLFFFLRRIA